MTKEKSLLFFFALTHTLIISFKGNNTLLSPFYFFFPRTILSLGCLFSKQLPLGDSLNSLVRQSLLLLSLLKGSSTLLSPSSCVPPK